MKTAGHPITPAGMSSLHERYQRLLGTERPAIVEIVSWAAGNGDRSENGDYLYGRKRMREIDRELAHLARRMKSARVIDPSAQTDRSRVWFGATVTIADEEDERRTLTLVGDDEQDAGEGRIGWSAPLARALRGSNRRPAAGEPTRRREGMGSDRHRLPPNRRLNGHRCKFALACGRDSVDHWRK